MNVRLFRISSLMLLLGIGLCGMGCDPDLPSGHAYDINIAAVKPAGTDSLKMCVSSSAIDSLECVTVSNSHGNAVFSDDWDSLKVHSENVEFIVDISFFCNGREIPLPTYVIEAIHSRRIDYDFRELDERAVNPRGWDYDLVTFLSPEDTSCGKFVNYAVFKDEG